MNNMNILEKPLTIEEIKIMSEKDGYVDGIVTATLDEIAYSDYERFLDMISIKLIGEETLRDISYRLEGSKDGLILIYVCGDVECFLENEEWIMSNA